ncbi:MAG: hypothetical protein Q9176_006555 [Flavoplaca citrina]
MPPHTNTAYQHQLGDPLLVQPGLREILLQIGERHTTMEKQLSELQASLVEVAALQAKAEQELNLLNERDDAWRAKIEEFRKANEAWAIRYNKLDRRRLELESQLNWNHN